MPAAIRCIGDSLTRGGGGVDEGWPAILAAALGWPTRNEGVPGQTSTQIAARLGAIRTMIELEGGAIPRAGPVACVRVDPDLLGPKHKVFLAGALEGVPGRLNHAKAGPYTFYRDNPGAEMPCPSGAVFVPAQPACAAAVLWMGENDVLNGVGREVIRANLAACIEAMAPEQDRFVVIGLFAGEGEEAGSRRHRLKLALNAELARAWPGQVLDLYTPLLSAADPKSPGDLEDQHRGVVPRSLRQDRLHLGPAGEAVVSRLVEAVFRSRGWCAT